MKLAIIIKLIASILTNIILGSIFFSAPIITKIVMIPFLICGLALMGQMIFLLMDKQKYYQLLSKVYVASFLLYWFGFLIFWLYLNIKNTNYVLLLLSIPFWLIGINLVRNNFKKKGKNKQK